MGKKTKETREGKIKHIGRAVLHKVPPEISLQDTIYRWAKICLQKIILLINTPW